MHSTIQNFLVILFFALHATTVNAVDGKRNEVEKIASAAVLPVMDKYHIPGMSVGIATEDASHILHYGVASESTGKPVTDNTLFELGSISKTLTATLTSYAGATGRLRLTDKTADHLPSLKGTAFGNLLLVDLGTHTSGGLPLQVPDAIQDNKQLMRYLKEWHPAHPPGTYRNYANPGIGMLGRITAESMDRGGFEDLMEHFLLPALGMHSTYIRIPASAMENYAQGHTKDGIPARMQAAVLSSEAYGLKSTAGDMVRFLKANMDLLPLRGKLRKAVMDTHTGYFKAGNMIQGLVWEEYPYPTQLETLLAGNSPEMIFNSVPVTALKPPRKLQENLWINKTGSTNGFGAYVAFIPEKRLGIVLLANKNFPINERVMIAYSILASLTSKELQHD